MALSRQIASAGTLLTMESVTKEVKSTFVALARGFRVTFRNLWRKPVTENYPDEPVHFESRYRGIHVLHRDENGLEKCVGCFLCAAACPARCIYIEAGENTEAHRISAGELYAHVYNIDYSRCIFCGYCVEACPKDAITHGYNFELSVYNRADLLKTKDDLLITKQIQSRNYRVASSDEDVDSEYKEV